MSASDTALNTIDAIAADGDLAPDPTADTLELEAARGADQAARRPADLPAAAARRAGRPGGLRIAGHGAPRPVDVPAADRAAGAGKSQIARAIAHRLWTGRGRSVEDRHGAPFYGYVEIAGGPSSDEYLFRHEFVPSADRASEIRLVDSAFVQAMRHGWLAGPVGMPSPLSPQS